MQGIHAKKGERAEPMRRKLWEVWALPLVASLLLMAQPRPVRAQGAEAQIQNLAFRVGQQVWNNLRLPGAFNPNSVIIAYENLSNSPMFTPADNTPLNRTHTFLQPGIFLNLVQQSVMVNAALDNVLNGPFWLTAAQVFAASDPVYRAPATQHAIHTLALIYGGYPHDPNLMAGPVACSTGVQHAGMLPGRRSRTAACLHGQGIPYLALPPYTYTINFYNNGVGPANVVTVTDYIDPATQNGLELADLTWNGQATYPTHYWNPQIGWIPIAPGQLAPVPGLGGRLSYSCANGLVFTLQCAPVQGLREYTWTFNTPNLPLNVAQSGSVSFLIEPNALPVGNNINDPAAYDAANGGPLNGNQVNNAFVTFTNVMATNVWRQLY